MARPDTKRIEEACGALKFEGLSVPEIERRLHNDEAGLGFPVQIKTRRIYEHISSYEEKHGPPPDPADEDQTLDSIARLKRRMLARMAKEVKFFEGKRPGKLTHEDSARIRQHFATIDSMEQREEAAAKRSRRFRSKGTQPESNGDGPEETAIERLAREEAVRPTKTTCPHGDPYCPCNDGDGCNYEDDEATGTKGLPSPLHAAPDPPQEEAA